MSEILLQTKALTKQYGHQKAVDNVDIHIKKGAIYGFIGRNGAGKTTCMRMIGGLAKPTSGEISMFWIHRKGFVEGTLKSGLPD